MAESPAPSSQMAHLIRYFSGTVAMVCRMRLAIL
jgi:hypothetical protein